MGMLSLAASGCGGAQRPDAHAAFASIQVDEARIEHAALALTETTDAETRSAARAEICEASAHLCETAGALEDRDALDRCAHAEERCAAARAGAAR